MYPIFITKIQIVLIIISLCFLKLVTIINLYFQCFSPLSQLQQRWIDKHTNLQRLAEWQRKAEGLRNWSLDLPKNPTVNKKKLL